MARLAGATGPGGHHGHPGKREGTGQEIKHPNSPPAKAGLAESRRTPQGRAGRRRRRAGSRVATWRLCLWAAPWAAELSHHPHTNLHLLLSPRTRSAGSLDLQSDRKPESSSQSIPQGPGQDPPPSACTQQAPAGLPVGCRKQNQPSLPSPEQPAPFPRALPFAFPALAFASLCCMATGAGHLPVLWKLSTPRKSLEKSLLTTENKTGLPTLCN